MPVSQLAGEHYPKVDDGNRAKILDELRKLVDQTLQVRVIDADPRTNKLIISEKAIAAEDIKERLTKYNVGDIVDGIITGVASFGVFMKFTNDPELEGLIHISELDHRLIENPKEIVKIDGNRLFGVGQAEKEHFSSQLHQVYRLELRFAFSHGFHQVIHALAAGVIHHHFPDVFALRLHGHVNPGNFAPHGQPGLGEVRGDNLGRAGPLEEVGKEFGVTRERIRQIEAKALEKMRKHQYAKKLEGY